MEFALIFFLTVMGLGNEIEKNNVEIDQLQKEVAQLDQQFLKLAGSHSAFYASQQLVNDATKEAIEKVVKEVNDHSHPHDHKLK